MAARPRVGLRYRQEYRRGEAEDRASVLALREQAEVPAGHFRRVLLTRDVNPLEPRVLEYKLYARGVGLVLATSVSGGSDREELVELQAMRRSETSHSRRRAPASRAIGSGSASRVPLK